MNLEKLIIVKQNILSPSIMFYVPSSSSGERFETLKRSKLCCLLAGLLLLLNLNSTHAFSPITIHALTQKSVFKNRFDSSNYQHQLSAVEDDEEHWMDFLMYDSQPNFDVVEMTKEYSSKMSQDEREKYYDDEYLFRGSIIGPITSKDIRETQKGFNILDAYPDIQIEKFGYTIDPENPYRCYWFERWKGTNTGPLNIGPLKLSPTNKVAKTPTHIMAVNWTPEGKIIYSCLSSPLDRFEGNTKGQGAVFGLLGTGGLKVPVSSPGNPFLIFNQKVIAPLINAKAFSDDSEISSWWKSKSRGADSNDV